MIGPLAHIDTKQNANTKVTSLQYATKLRQGNIFTSVCQDILSTGGGCLPQCMLGYPPGQTPPLGRPPGQTPPTPAFTPWADTAGQTPLGTSPGQTPPADTPLPSACWDTHHLSYPVHAGTNLATAADGMHPTGMHSCFKYDFETFSILSQSINVIFALELKKNA